MKENELYTRKLELNTCRNGSWLWTDQQASNLKSIAMTLDSMSLEARARAASDVSALNCGEICTISSYLRQLKRARRPNVKKRAA